jgi:hypothetical protein
MVGLVIQLFTLNLAFDSEFFIRLAAVVFGTLSTFMMFLIGSQIKNPLTGLYAALLYTASFYGFILCGTFILPDSPQVFFWLLTILFLLKSLPDRNLLPKSRRFLLLAGVAAGMAMLSKYHSVFLVTGAFFYIILYNRRWFRATETYIALLIFILLCLPVAWWNYDNNFISFSFHENRIGITSSGLQPKYFFTEIAGEFFYNNPINVVIIIISLIALIRRRSFLGTGSKHILIWVSVPLVLVFMSFSLFRSTLPHWTGPGYLGFMLIAAAYLSEPSHRGSKLCLVPLPLVFALAFVMIIAVTAVAQIRYGVVPLSRWKIRDFSHDLSGWRQLGEKFAPVAKRDQSSGTMGRSAPVITFRWFPAANLDYYVASKLNLPVYAIGSLERIHKYYWINNIHGTLKQGTNAYYIALSDDYEDPVALYGELFDTITPPDTITLTRGRDTIRKAFVYRLMDLKKEMTFPITKTSR